MIALLSANWDEISQLKKNIKITTESDHSELDYIIGELYGQSILLAVTGVGIKRARTATSYIIQKFKPSIIIFGGFGGALSPDLKVGKIILGESVTSLKKNETLLLYNDFLLSEIDYKKGALLTESRFINESDQKKHLFDSTGALIVDMETWGVVEAARQSGIPVASLRAVSNAAEEHLPDMAAIYSESGELDVVKAEPYFKENPELLAPYLNFRLKNTPKASESLCNFLFHLLSAL